MVQLVIFALFLGIGVAAKITFSIYIISILMVILAIFFYFKYREYSRLVAIFSFVGMLLTGMGYLRGFKLDMFYLFASISIMFASSFEMSKKRWIAFLAWATNGIALYFFINNVISKYLAILVGVIIFLSGFKDIFPEKSKRGNEDDMDIDDESMS